MIVQELWGSRSVTPAGMPSGYNASRWPNLHCILPHAVVARQVYGTRSMSLTGVTSYDWVISGILIESNKAFSTAMCNRGLQPDGSWCTIPGVNPGILWQGIRRAISSTKCKLNQNESHGQSSLDFVFLCNWHHGPQRKFQLRCCPRLRHTFQATVALVCEC